MAYQIAEADDWDEIPMARVFEACADVIPPKPRNPPAVYTISGVLADGLSRKFSDPHMAIDLHREICKTAEFKLAMRELGQWQMDNFYTSITKNRITRGEIIQQYFILLSLWANDCGLTLQIRSDTHQFEIVHNTSQGPKLWS